MPSSLPAAISASRLRTSWISQSMKSPCTGALCPFEHSNTGIACSVSLSGPSPPETEASVFSSQAFEHRAQRGIFRAMTPPLSGALLQLLQDCRVFQRGHVLRDLLAPGDRAQ